VGWSWGYDPSSANHNVIEHNHIHNLGKYLLSDMGGIYTLGIAPGTTLRYNRIHDVYSFTYGGWGIYPDEGSSELLIENNVVYDTKTGGFHQHYGKENRVRNNIFAFSREGQVIRSREEDHISFFFERNIVYFDNGRLLGSTWKNGNFRLDYNCYWDASGAPVKFLGKTFEDWQATGQDPHSIIADPLFEDPAARDFRLKPESPAIAQLGFEPIDISGAGLYGDPEWVNAPRQITRAPYGPPPEG
jgi:parallel beta-helix repeat protein